MKLYQTIGTALATLALAGAAYAKDCKSLQQDYAHSAHASELDRYKAKAAMDYVCSGGAQYTQLKACLDEAKSTTSVDICVSALSITDDLDDLEKWLEEFE